MLIKGTQKEFLTTLKQEIWVTIMTYMFKAWQAFLKMTEVELELLNDINMLLIVEKRIRGGICHAIHRYAKGNKKYMKNYEKNKESSYIQYLDVNNQYG